MWLPQYLRPQFIVGLSGMALAVIFQIPHTSIPLTAVCPTTSQVWNLLPGLLNDSAYANKLHILPNHRSCNNPLTGTFFYSRI